MKERNSPSLIIAWSESFVAARLCPDHGTQFGVRLTAWAQLFKRKVLIVGAGGLRRSLPAVRLAHGGVTHITLIDPELIELSNLARQIIYTALMTSGYPRRRSRPDGYMARFPGLDVAPIAWPRSTRIMPPN